jgi:hypothetical protein
MLLLYEEMDKLRPRSHCASLRYWFDGDVWQCSACVPPDLEDLIELELDPPKLLSTRQTMCGGYRLTRCDISFLKEYYGVEDVHNLPADIFESYNIAPGSFQPVVVPELPGDRKMIPEHEI